MLTTKLVNYFYIDDMFPRLLFVSFKITIQVFIDIAMSVLQILT